MEETNGSGLPSGKQVMCQLARMGDLVQMRPLIEELRKRGPLSLVCDQAVLDWAECLPGIDRILPLDTGRWRKVAVAESLDLNSVLIGLQAELGDILSLDAKRFYPMNDHPLCDRLAASICEQHVEQWLNQRLVMVRSYLRSVVTGRRWSRIHLSDVWRSLAGESGSAEIPPIPANDEGRQFAKDVLNVHRSASHRPLMAFILGSGGRFRRIDPEDFSSWWCTIPEGLRPGCVLVGGKGEEELGQRFLQAVGSNAKGVINLIGSCTPGGLLGIFNHVDLVIGVDTGPLHWAAATGTKVLGIYFGEAGFYETGPYGSGHVVLAPDCEDYPCGQMTAQRCGYRCLQMLKDPKKMADLFISCLQGSPLDVPLVPDGYRLFRSRWTTSGQQYEALSGGVDSPEVIVFSDFVHHVLNDSRLTDDSEWHPETLFQPLEAGCASQFQCGTIDILIHNWLQAIRDLPVVKTIPAAFAEKVKFDSMEYLNYKKASFLASDENEPSMRI